MSAGEHFMDAGAYEIGGVTLHIAVEKLR